VREPRTSELVTVFVQVHRTRKGKPVYREVFATHEAATIARYKAYEMGSRGHDAACCHVIEAEVKS
jgi:hypothetical protein